MNKMRMILVLTAGLVAGVQARAALGDLTTSTDPAKAASVEQHAAALKSERTKTSGAAGARQHSVVHHHKGKHHAAAKHVKASGKSA